MTTIATVRLHALIRVQAVSKYIIEYGNVIVLPSRIWTVDPYEMAGPDADAKLVPERRLTSILVRSICIAFYSSSLLVDTVVGTVDTHEAVIQDVIIIPLIKINLAFQ